VTEVCLVWLEYPSGTRIVLAVYEDYRDACQRVQEERARMGDDRAGTAVWVSSRTVVRSTEEKD
jgi:hypothetical protein